MNNFADLSSNFEYGKGSLDLKDCPAEPHVLFLKWLDEVRLESGMHTAMVLSTTGKDMRPSARVVFLKGADYRGFKFYTNYESKKGRELLANPFAALTFHWADHERQVRIEGSVERLPEEESDSYFKSRGRDSQVASIISRQSEEVPDRQYLENQAIMFEKNIGEGDRDLKRPPSWGGYILIPDLFEFWQGRPGRLNDRIQYNLEGKNWLKRRLAP